MGSLSPVHWMLVGLVVLLLFGPARLAAFGRDVGQGIRSFKKGVSEDPAHDDGKSELGAVQQQAENASHKPPSELRPN